MASDQHDNNVNPTERSAAMVPTSNSTSQMTNSAWFGSGSGIHSEQTNDPEFSVDELLTSDEMFERGVEHSQGSQQTSQTQLNATNRSPADQFNSLQSPVGGMRLFQQHQSGQSQDDQLNSVQYTSDGVMHYQQANQPLFNVAYQSQPNQSNSLHSVQPHQLNQAGRCQTDQLNSLRYLRGELMHFNRTNPLQLNEAQQSQVDQSNSQQPLNQAFQRQTDLMRLEETRQPQLSQGAASQDSQQIKSGGSGKTLAGQETKSKSATYSAKLREKENKRKEIADDIFDKIERGENIRGEEYRGKIPKIARKSKNQRSHHPNFSAPAVASFPTDHHGTESGMVRQIGTGLQIVRNARMAVQEASAAVKKIQQNSTSWAQTDEPLSAHARHPTSEMTPADRGFQTIFSGSPMTNDAQDPRLRASTRSATVVIRTENQDSSQTRGMPIAELPKKSKSEDMTVVSNRQGASDEILQIPQMQHRDEGSGLSTTLLPPTHVVLNKENIEKVVSESRGCQHKLFTLIEYLVTENEKLRAEVTRLNGILGSIRMRLNG